MSSPYLKMSKTSAELNPQHLLLTLIIMFPLFHLRPLSAPLLLSSMPFSSSHYMFSGHITFVHGQCASTLQNFLSGKNSATIFCALKTYISNFAKKKKRHCAFLVILFCSSTILHLLPLLQGSRRLRESEFAFHILLYSFVPAFQACSIASVSATSSASHSPNIFHTK